MSRHLVLGGGGFIGSHLAARLSKQGHTVRRVDIEFPVFRERLFREGYPGGPVRRSYSDLRKPEQAGLEILASHPDVVWQLAADMGGVEYFHSEHDWQAAVNNQMINVNVMDAVAKYAPNARVIFTSTACALATEKQTHAEMAYSKGQIPRCSTWYLREGDIGWGTPDQLYGQEKRNSALLWRRSPLDTRVCFLHTVYGPYQEHSGIRMKFPSAVAQKARRARETGTMEIFGDGRQVRTYLYVDDAVDRLLSLGGSDTDPGFVNIGGIVPYTVDQVAVIALDVAGCDAHWNYDVAVKHVDGPTGVEARSCDMSRFNHYFPEYDYEHRFDVPLHIGMKRFIRWLDEVDPQ